MGHFAKFLKIKISQAKVVGKVQVERHVDLAQQF
jgi:hypothetical protein